MKKIFSILASVALTASLTGCPGEETKDPIKPEVTSVPATPTPEAPVETPTPEAPVATPEAPVATPDTALPVPSAEAVTGFSITSSTAKKQANFSYNITIKGTGMGTAADYTSFRVEVSGSTVPLVQNGEQRTKGDASEINITDTEVTYNWKPSLGAPTDNDLVKIHTQKKGEDSVSTDVRIAVDNNV